MFATAREALKFIAENGIEQVDLKIVGLTGRWLHVTIPARQFSERHFESGVGYDGAAGAGFASIENGDVVARPEPATGFLDPFWERPTLSFLCDTLSADTREPLPADPRTIARRAVEHLRSSGIADEAWMAPEFEFHVFDRVEVVSTPYRFGVAVCSGEVEPEGLAPPLRPRGGYFRTPPDEHLHELRGEICGELERLGVAVRYHHHEVGAPGQCEIEVELRPLLQAADQALLVKYVIRNVARRHGKLATFMPKPIFGEAGNGMHVHQRLTLRGKPLFSDPQGRNYAGLSDLALHYIAGLLLHGPALTAITNPTTNSYKRLVEGYEAPVKLFFSLANRSAAIRVPRYALRPEDKRIEYRPPDASGNIHLTLAAMLLAGLDGVRQQADPQAHQLGPFDVDISRQSEDFRARIRSLPGSLEAALDALESDHAFLLQGEVFSAALVADWIAGRRAEAAAVATRPHPHEYLLYLDV